MHASQLMKPGISQNVSCTVGDFAIYVYMVHRKTWDQRSKSDSSNFLTMSNAVDHSRGSFLIQQPDYTEGGGLSRVFPPWLSAEVPLIKVVTKAAYTKHMYNISCPHMQPCFAFLLHSGAGQLQEDGQRLHAAGRQRAISYRKRCRSSEWSQKRTMYQNNQPLVC